jgi:hypothetical protein
VKKSEIAKILTVAKSLDDWVTVDEPRIMAWQLALIPEITYEFALEAIGRHYSRSDKPLMPVHINDPWRAYRADLHARNSVLQLGNRESVPPTEIYLKMRQALQQISEEKSV